MIDFERTVRPSGLPTWLDCSRRWAATSLPALVQAYGYSLAKRPPKHIGAHIGTAVHVSAAYGLSEKIVTGKLGNEAEAIDRGITNFDLAASAEGVTWDSTTDSRPTAQRQIERMTRSHRQHLAPGLEPIIAEERAEADVGDGWTVSGQIDVLAQNAGGPGLLRDLKTGTSRRVHHVQYGAYKMLFDVHGYQVDGMIEDFLPRVALQKSQPAPTAHPVDVTEALADAWTAIADIKRSVDEFQRRAETGQGGPPHAAFRPNPDSQLCSPKWCPAHGTPFCKAHK